MGSIGLLRLQAIERTACGHLSKSGSRTVADGGGERDELRRLRRRRLRRLNFYSACLKWGVVVSVYLNLIHLSISLSATA